MTDIEFGLLVIMIGFKLVFGFVGGVLIYALRNDHVETILGLEATRSTWMIVSFGYALALFSLHTFPAMSPFWAALSALCAAGWTAVIWSTAHGPCLRGPRATLRWDPDHILYWCLRLWRGKQIAARATTLYPDETKEQMRGFVVAPKIGLDVWLTYGFVRYCLPCIVIGIFIPNTLVWLAGPLIMLGYWPLGHWWERNMDAKAQFAGAFVAGFVFYGLI
jgi:hypothetical protein